jgi:hypothetical protein
MPKFKDESRTEYFKRMARCVLTPTDEDRGQYFRGLFSISASIIKLDRKHYPVQVHLKIRTGRDQNEDTSRVYTTVEMTWKEVEELHADLGRQLRDRAALKKKLEPFRK